MRLTVIGCGTAQPQPDTPASGLLVESGDTRVLLDCGQGVISRLERHIDPLSLSFRPVEIAALAGSVLFTTAVLFDGRSSRGRGAALLFGYAVVVVGFYVAGER